MKYRTLIIDECVKELIKQNRSNDIPLLVAYNAKHTQQREELLLELWESISNRLEQT